MSPRSPGFLQVDLVLKYVIHRDVRFEMNFFIALWDNAYERFLAADWKK